VAVVGPDEFCAITSNGDYDSTTLFSITRLDHWDGSNWQTVHIASGDEIYERIWASAPDDVWILGERAADIPTRLAIWHWDGASLVDAGSLDFSPGTRSSAELDGSGPGDIWVVGGRDLAYHFDGQSWLRYDFPSGTGDLIHIGVVSATDVWAVAKMSDTSSILHFDGTRWAKETDPAAGKQWSGIRALGAGDVWAFAADSSVWRYDAAGWHDEHVPSASVAFGVVRDDHGDPWLVGSLGMTLTEQAQ
jgi:hypothetical protein